MHVVRRTLIVFGLSLLALPGIAMASGTNTNSMYREDTGFNPKMLDTSVPEAQRLKLFAQVISLAKQNRILAQDLAGTMYWQGARIHGSPVQSNLAQAHILLSNAAVHGDVLAMAKMAEMELKAGHPQKAMVWAQLYAHYINPLVSARERHGRNYAYASDLIHRIAKAGGKINGTVSKETGAMVTRFNTPIRAGITAFRDQRRNGSTRLVMMPAGSVPKALRTQSGVAEFMVAFKPSGAPGKAWLIASYPTSDLGTMLQSWIGKARANQVHASTGVRYMLVSIPHYSVKYHPLRAHH